MLGLFSYKLKPQEGIDKNKTLSELTALLTAIRVSGYNTEEIASISKAKLSLISALIINLGNKILKTRIESEEPLARAKLDFSQLIKRLAGDSNTVAFVRYACQLLQYYTLLCDKEFVPDMTLQDWQNFLYINKESFGDTTNNPFVIEYALIKIFNQLNELTDSVEGKIAPLPQLDETRLYLHHRLEKLAETINLWASNDTNNVFFHYLKFVYHYAYSKAIELQFLAKKVSLTEEENVNLSDSQQLYLLAAKDSINKIDTLYEQTKNNAQLVIQGTEFSFGLNVLIKLPTSDINQIKEHLSSLTIGNRPLSLPSH
ncbi:hypothetical protein RVIR1_07890 [Candidatus Rickettsiella viridis]|uniref:Uncharacterized protein n=1 Tax=Candidatus Rickettsiella viridis TaxID=676208 RepID=A0A2Z5UUV4_9COXI|nr:hypothetical protein [Candidatus Rickettsiella viridis]BBB15278.1 hypothetical protein RVIR1_07890 [Candidatus Rickettsiella viridis]